ncbi:MAG: MopE-related protein [Archangium sp.]|nr:MopE-related protein [Archangium sp.]
MKHWLCYLLLAGCRIYDPQPIDCRILCTASSACPDELFCRDGFCRLPRATTVCECRAEEERACGTTEGACQPGVQRCEGTQWGACENAIGPRPELCNGLDDDCDGFIDEELSLPPTCARTLGVCMNSRQQCLDGEWRACDDTAYGPFFEPVETRCDGRDNDCDGLVDVRPIVSMPVMQGALLSPTTTGYVLIAPTQATWLSRSLEVEANTIFPEQLSLASTTHGDTVVLTQRTDAGVMITSVDRDRAREQLVPTWRNATALELAGEVVAVIVNGQVELISVVDGGAPVIVGSDTDGTLKLSQTGRFLAWSGGVVRTEDLGTLRSGSVGPLSALIELESALVGVPLAQTGAPAILPNVLTGRPAQPLFSGFVPPLSELQAIEHRGGVLMLGRENPGAVLWMVSERGAQRANPLITAAAPSREEMALFTAAHDGGLGLIRQCTP